MGKAVTLDLSKFIGKALDLIVTKPKIKKSLYLDNIMEEFIILRRFFTTSKLKSTILNIIPTKFIPNPDSRCHNQYGKRKHMYTCLVITNKYNYILKFTSKYIIQYITIGHINYKRNDKIWEKQ
jgi:hypothetical protein